MKKTAFTLVELIVVITILAILATIGFVSFSGYLAGTRDTNRIAQLKSMSDALELYRTKKDLPIPDDKVDVQAGTTTIAYQGYIGSNVLETIEYTEKGLDPKDKTYFSYYLTKNKKYFQLLSFLEEPSEDVLASNTNTDTYTNRNNNIFTSSQATDYSERYPHTKGKKLGILTDENNTPIQEVSAIETAGSLDIVNTTDVYSVILDGSLKVTGTGGTIAFIEETSLKGGKIYKSCKDILNKGSSVGDGFYTVYPNYKPIDVYCDMTVAGGGWTLAVATYYAGSSNGVGHLAGSDAYGLLSDAITGVTGSPGGRYKLSDENIKLIQNLSSKQYNADYLFNQIGHNIYYSGGNNEYVTLENYTKEWNYGGNMGNSTSNVTVTSYRRSDGAIALKGIVPANTGCSVGEFGINCNFQPNLGAGGGSSCDIDLRTAPATTLTRSGPMSIYMENTNADTYLYVCNGAQHSSSNRYKSRYFIRERN